MDEITMRQPDDWHAHLRIGDLMAAVIGLFNIYGRVVCVGNLADPVDNLRKTITYRNAIRSWADFLPIIGVMLTHNSTVEEWQKIFDLFGNTAFIKYMLEGISTNSELGILWTELKNYYPILELAQDRQIPILIHAEIDKDPKTGRPIDEINREKVAVSLVAELAEVFPHAIFNVEHVSTRAMIELIKAYDNLSGSISPNHLIHSYGNVFDNHGSITNVHKYFKPVAKKHHDRKAVAEAALSGNKKFFFGSDSAPHFQVDKEKFCLAGAFNTLTNLSCLYELFLRYDARDKFEPFVSGYGARRYNFPQNVGTIKLRREKWQVPSIYRGMVPDLAGRVMEWKVVE